MTIKIQHKRSAVKDKVPLPTDLEYGEIAVNYEATDPALYVKDSADAVRRIGNAPDATETAKGILQLATAAETTAGTDATKAVHPAGLKVELDKKVKLAGDKMTGTLSSTERTSTGAVDLATGNFWTVGAVTVAAPTNAVAGTSGLFRVTAAPVGWATAYKWPGGAAPTIAAFPAIVPFYVQAVGVIMMGKPVEGIA